MHVSFIVKLTRGCNLRCTYCYDWREQQAHIDPAIYSDLIDSVLARPEFTGVTFVWHGGEPLLAGRRRLEDLLAMQERLLVAGRDVKNSIQTNGTLLSEEWIALFKDRGIKIGLSFDGPPELHDIQRPRTRGRPTSAVVQAAIAQLLESRVSFGVLTVVTQETIEYGAARLFDYLLSLGIKRMGMLRHRPEVIEGKIYDAADGFVTHEEFALFERDLFDRWLDLDDPTVDIRDFSSVVRSFVGGPPLVCTLGGACVGKNYSLEMNGDVYHCDHFQQLPHYRVGNVQTDAPDDMFAGAALANIARIEAERLEMIGSCRYFRVCRGGCPSDTYVDERMSGSGNVDCCGRAGLLEHAERRLRTMAPRVSLVTSDSVPVTLGRGM